MLANVEAIRAINPTAITWVYRNGIKALPWFTTVRKLLEDPAMWGFFMPYAGCMPSPGHYVCGDNATANLYHDFEQTPTGDCGVGIQCGEYVFNHRNASLLPNFLLKDYFFGATSAGSPAVMGVRAHTQPSRSPSYSPTPAAAVLRRRRLVCGRPV